MLDKLRWSSKGGRCATLKNQGGDLIGWICDEGTHHYTIHLWNDKGHWHRADALTAASVLYSIRPKGGFRGERGT
jgi:hypothetical protein